MTSRDLMIDDWVQTNHDGKIIKYQVHMLSDDNIIGNYLVCREVDPVPLTPEILEKNGFQKISANKYVSGKVTIAVFAEEFLVTIKSGNARVMITIKYVHELQHAFRLCKIDKEIEL